MKVVVCGGCGKRHAGKLGASIECSCGKTVRVNKRAAAIERPKVFL